MSILYPNVSSTEMAWHAASTTASTTPGILLAGVLVRMVLHALGPCTREIVLKLLESTGSKSSSISIKRSSDAGSSRTPTRSSGVGPRIGMQIRRGDSCERWAKAGDGEARRQRPCFRASSYLEAARRLRGRWRRGAGKPMLLVATDSADVLYELRANFTTADEFEMIAVGGARGDGWGGVREGGVLGTARQHATHQFIENRNGRGLVDRAAVLSTFFADLLLLSTADMLVGTAASWTSRLALYAIVGESGALPPFEMIDRPLRGLWFS